MNKKVLTSIHILIVSKWVSIANNGLWALANIASVKTYYVKPIIAKKMLVSNILTQIKNFNSAEFDKTAVWFFSSLVKIVKENRRGNLY